MATVDELKINFDIRYTGDTMGVRTHRIYYPGCVIEGVQSYRMRVYLDGVDVTDRARIADEGMQMVVLLKLNEDSKIFPADEDGRFALEMKRGHVVILLPGEELED